MHWTLQWSFSTLSRYIFPNVCKETMSSYIFTYYSLQTGCSTTNLKISPFLTLDRPEINSLNLLIGVWAKFAALFLKNMITWYILIYFNVLYINITLHKWWKQFNGTIIWWVMTLINLHPWQWYISGIRLLWPVK